MSRPRAERIFDVDPVLRRAGRNNVERAERLQIPRKSLLRHLAEGRLAPDAADRLAIRAGYHPTEIWGDQWLLAEDRPEEGAA